MSVAQNGAEWVVFDQYDDGICASLTFTSICFRNVILCCCFQSLNALILLTSLYLLCKAL